MTPHERFQEFIKTRHGGGSKFIQDVVSSPKFRKGALTKKAKAHGETAMEYAKDVLAHPEKHDTRTKRQAQFAVNAQRRRT